MPKRGKLTYAQRRAKLESEYRELAKYFNEMESEIKNAGKHSRAVDYIKSTIDSSISIGKRGNLLNRLKKRGLENYKKNINLLKGFKESRTSTLQGVLDVEKERIESIKETYPELEKMSDDEIIEMLNFLGSARGKDSKKTYDSDQLILAIGLQKIGSKDKSIEDIYSDMQESNKTMADYIRQSLEENENKDWISF